jgi:hypothetical protein
MTERTAIRWVRPGLRIVGVVVDQRGQIDLGSLGPWRNDIRGADGAMRYLVAGRPPGYRVSASIEVDTIEEAAREAAEIGEFLMQELPGTKHAERAAWLFVGSEADRTTLARAVWVLPGSFRLGNPRPRRNASD